MFNNLYDKMERKPERIYGDSAYDTDEVRDRLEGDGVQANIPVNSRNGRRQIPYDEKRARAAAALIRMAEKTNIGARKTRGWGMMRYIAPKQENEAKQKPKNNDKFPSSAHR